MVQGAASQGALPAFNGAAEDGVALIVAGRLGHKEAWLGDRGTDLVEAHSSSAEVAQGDPLQVASLGEGTAEDCHPAEGWVSSSAWGNQVVPVHWLASASSSVIGEEVVPKI